MYTAIILGRGDIEVGYSLVISPMSDVRNEARKKRRKRTQVRVNDQRAYHHRCDVHEERKGCEHLQSALELATQAADATELVDSPYESQVIPNSGMVGVDWELVHHGCRALAGDCLSSSTASSSL